MKMSEHWALRIFLVACVLSLCRAGIPCSFQYRCVAPRYCLRQASTVNTLAKFTCQDSEQCCEVLREVDEDIASREEQPVEVVSSIPQRTTPTASNPPVVEGGTLIMTPLQKNDNLFKHCGWSNPKGLDSNLEHFGDEARPAEFPWVIALFHKDTLFGGGTLVAPGVVLTASHVVVGKSLADIVVRAGDWDLESNREFFKRQERTIVRILRHEAFQAETGANNLALLFLNWPFQLGDHIGSICLPYLGRSRQIKESCYLAGWGKRKSSDHHISPILRKINLPVVNKNTCQNQLRRTNLGLDYNLPVGVVCAGSGINNDACNINGGSALVCPLRSNPNRFEQIGIVSFGVQCGTENVPAVYTDVSQFREWIDYNIKIIQLDIQQFGHWNPTLPVLQIN